MSSVLVIDDEKTVLTMVKEVLKKFGHQVETASDGKEGIEKFNCGSYDLVITDILMPGLDGNCVAQYIRSSGKKLTPIIGISGTPWRTEDIYFDSILAKPFPIKTLVNNVKELSKHSV